VEVESDRMRAAMGEHEGRAGGEKRTTKYVAGGGMVRRKR
jgi:hypothetical protein